MLKDSYKTTARKYAPGIGDAVADRTINRKIFRPYDEPKIVKITVPRRDDSALDGEVAAYAKMNGYRIEGYKVDHGNETNVEVSLRVIGEESLETWEDVAHRVALGNSSLVQGFGEEREFHAMHHHLRQASILMSGRHLQHGDEFQRFRNQEVFTNCLDGSTRILTMEHGPIEIEKIAGQVVSVIAADGLPRTALINEHGEQDLFEISFKSAKGPGGKIRKTVIATANHRWKLSDGSFTDSLKVGDRISAIADVFGMDSTGIVHGLLFGDGSAHKSRIDAARHYSQGRTYASIRVCKQDSVREEIHAYLDAAGYKYTTPESANGDRVYYIGKFEGAKEVPFSRDPEYIAGFIYGWWLADGSKSQFRSLEISTCDASAAEWLEEHAGYAGFNVTMHRVHERKEGDGAFANGKPLHFLRLRKNVEWKVESIEPVGRAKVYCPEEPITTGFVLANGLLTGNCSSSATSFLKYYLLLNGSGVGRAYDDAMMVVDWREMPIVECAIGYEHQDVQQGLIKPNPLRDLEHLYADSRIHVFEVPDSREGWAKAIEKIEQMASERIYRDHVLILDFNGVRPKGSPIKGMQDRPASGPGPMIDTINKIKAIRNTDMEPWRATMFVDHYLSECVLVGGARRAARMATKTWRDANVIDFINLKRGGFLWSSNNSVTVDEEFWKLVKATDDDLLFESDETVALAKHAKEVFEQICTAAYYDETGEPGIINADRLVWNKEGIEELLDGDFAESERYKVDPETGHLMRSLAHAWKNSSTPAITNPCGEIVLNALGGYCVIADVVPYHAGSAGQSTSSQWWDEEVAAQEWDHDAEDAFRTATRALIRVNTMDSLYSKEVKRTNRIGVGITGLHEYAWSRFEYGWHDLIDEEKSKDFWLTLSRFKRAVVDEAKKYSTALGLKIPHTNTTIKPAGCASLDTAIKTTEGALTMRELFAKHGVTEDDLRGMEDGTWIEPKIKTLVLDEGNVEREVTKLYLNGVKPVYEIEFEDGTVVKLTGNHKLKTVAGEWKRVDELTDTDEILQF